MPTTRLAPRARSPESRGYDDHQKAKATASARKAVRPARKEPSKTITVRPPGDVFPPSPHHAVHFWRLTDAAGKNENGTRKSRGIEHMAQERDHASCHRQRSGRRSHQCGVRMHRGRTNGFCVNERVGQKNHMTLLRPSMSVTHETAKRLSMRTPSRGSGPLVLASDEN